MSRTGPRCFTNDGALVPFDAATEIPRQASILVTRWPPVESSFNKEEDIYGWYSGPTSIALLLFNTRDVLPEKIEGKSPVQWAKEYLAVTKILLDGLPEGDEKTAITPSYCGLVCEAICFAVTSAIIDKDESLLAPLWDHAAEIIEAKDTYDEWVLGRAGYLYSLRLTRSHFPHLAPRINDIIFKVVEAIVIRSPDSTNPWTCYNRLYLGAGHGWVGNLTQILLSDPSPARVKQVRPWLLDCIRQQCDSGNWLAFTSTYVEDPANPRENIDEIVQFGHGAPGIVSCLLCVRHLYEGDSEVIEELDNAVNKAQECIWTRGLLRKESCLQHGAAGNSLGLLDRKRKETFLAVSTQDKVDERNASGEVEASNSGSGLHRGLAGRIWAMAELQRGRNGVFLSFTDV